MHTLDCPPTQQQRPGTPVGYLLIRMTVHLCSACPWEHKQCRQNTYQKILDLTSEYKQKAAWLDPTIRQLLNVSECSFARSPSKSFLARRILLVMSFQALAFRAVCPLTIHPCVLMSLWWRLLVLRLWCTWSLLAVKMPLQEAHLLMFRQTLFTQ